MHWWCHGHRLRPDDPLFVYLRDSLVLPTANPWPLEAGASRQQALRQVAKSIASNEPEIAVASPYVSGMHGPMLDAPTLVVEDHGAIRLFEYSGDAAYSYRALLLAGDDDLVALGIERSGGFEDYCRDWLGLGSPQLLIPMPGKAGASLSKRCTRDEAFLEYVIDYARDHGGLNLLPYMTNWTLWKLAATIAGQGRVPLRVIGPPPQLSNRVNNKIWFAQLAQAVCGTDAVAPTLAADNIVRLCQFCRELMQSHASIAVKLPDSASSAGNLVLDTRLLRDISPSALHEELDRRLRALGWIGEFPLQVVAWKQAVLNSPSAQLWIPVQGEGEPLVEAIFEQHTSGLRREFVGARPCSLSDDWQRDIAQQAYDMAIVLQQLGYVGRCSLDAILAGTDEASARLYWVECNGRWGGASIPMTLNRRLDRMDSNATICTIFEETHQSAGARQLNQVLQLLEPCLYRQGQREHGVVLLSPGRLLEGSGYEFMVRHADVGSAMQLGARAASLLGNNS